jgi:hypothetical protein
MQLLDDVLFALRVGWHERSLAAAVDAFHNIRQADRDIVDPAEFGYLQPALEPAKPPPDPQRDVELPNVRDALQMVRRAIREANQEIPRSASDREIENYRSVLNVDDLERFEARLDQVASIGASTIDIGKVAGIGETELEAALPLAQRRMLHNEFLELVAPVIAVLEGAGIAVSTAYEVREWDQLHAVPTPDAPTLAEQLDKMQREANAGSGSYYELYAQRLAGMAEQWIECQPTDEMKAEAKALTEERGIDLTDRNGYWVHDVEDNDIHYIENDAAIDDEFDYNHYNTDDSENEL